MKIQKLLINVLSVTIAACTTCLSIAQEHPIPEQDENFWVVLNAKDAKLEDDTLSWDFTLKVKGEYDAQIVSDGELTTPLPKMKVDAGETKIHGVPKKIFVLGESEKTTISQFDSRLVFKEAGIKTLKVRNDSAIQQIRITPYPWRIPGFTYGKFAEEWSAMHNSPEKQATLEWFNEAKYGMFIHWGLYSQAGGIWKETKIHDAPYPGPNVAEWLMYRFRIPRDEYRELAKTFNPDKSFAANIAKLAKDAGMKYVVITSKHHDGFALFDSKCSEYDITDAAPYDGDAIKELYDACLAEGLQFGVYYSPGYDWTDGADAKYFETKNHCDSVGVKVYSFGRNNWDPSPNSFEDYVDNKVFPQLKELMELLPELKLFWLDGAYPMSEEKAFSLYKMVYNINPNIIISRRVNYNFGDYHDSGDNVIPAAKEKHEKQWEVLGTTNNTWGYSSYDEGWKSEKEMLYYLVNIASKGGNYLLNIGPDGKGHVPEKSAELLRELGKWLDINGEAIYGTTNWKTSHEGQEETSLVGTHHREKRGFTRTFSSEDFWFTTKEDKVYAISLVKAEGQVQIKSLRQAAAKIETVGLLGNSEKINWEQSDDCLNVDLSGMSTGDNGYVLEVTLKK